MNLFDLSALLLIAFYALSLVDGLYFHLYAFRLHARPETRREHWAHTGRALLFIPTLLLVIISHMTNNFKPFFFEAVRPILFDRNIALLER